MKTKNINGTAKTNHLNATRRLQRKNGVKKTGKVLPAKTPATRRGGPRPAGREKDMVSNTSATARGGPRPGPGRERAPGTQRESAPRPPGALRHEHSRVDLLHGGRTGSCACGKDFKQSPEAVRHFTKMGYSPRFRCYPCSAAKKLRHQTASASSPIPEQTPAAPPGPATFPLEEHGAAAAPAAAAADPTLQLAAVQAEVRELASALSMIHATVNELQKTITSFFLSSTASDGPSVTTPPSPPAPSPGSNTCAANLPPNATPTSPLANPALPSHFT